MPLFNKQIRLIVFPISSKTRWAGPFCLILPAVQNACKECSVYMYSSLLPSYFDTKKSTPSKPLRNFLAQKLGVGVKVELYCLPFRLSEKVSPIHQATTTYLCGLYIGIARTFSAPQISASNILATWPMFTISATWVIFTISATYSHSSYMLYVICLIEIFLNERLLPR